MWRCDCRKRGRADPSFDGLFASWVDPEMVAKGNQGVKGEPFEGGKILEGKRDHGQG